MSSEVDTLVAVVVGAGVGFLASIGLYEWQGWSRTRSVKNRLKGELRAGRFDRT